MQVSISYALYVGKMKLFRGVFLLNYLNVLLIPYHSCPDDVPHHVLVNIVIWMHECGFRQ
jgi:hypothetical protein